MVAILLRPSVHGLVIFREQLNCSGFDLNSINMQTVLQPLHHRCGIALLPSRRSKCSQNSSKHVRGIQARHALQLVVRCDSSDTDRQGKAGCTSRTLLGAALAAAISMGALSSTESALAKTNPVKKSDPYEVIQRNTARIESKQWFFVTCHFHVQDLQNIIKSRSSGSSVSLFESFKQQAQEAAKIPAEILKAPTEAFQPAHEAPAIPLPITKALPQPTSKAAAGTALCMSLILFLSFVRCSDLCCTYSFRYAINGMEVHSALQVFHVSLALAPDSRSKYGCVCKKFVLARMLLEYGMLSGAAQTVL